LDERSEPARYITQAEADAIQAKLPEYLRPLFSLALALGIRRGQLSRTLRRYVDLERGVIAWPPSECKHRGAHTVPLDAEPLAIVQAAMDAAVPWCPFLLHGPDCAPGRKPSKRYGCVGDGRDAFQNAVEAAGLPFGRKAGGIVFHCTRNTAATDMRAGGLSQDDCMKIGGWKTAHVFQRYDLGDTEALRGRLAAARARRGQVVPMRRRADG
jgi:integrase